MKRLHQLLFVVALFYLFAAQMRECSKLRDAPIVNTKYGSIQGVADSYASMYLGMCVNIYIYIYILIFLALYFKQQTRTKMLINRHLFCKEREREKNNVA